MSLHRVSPETVHPELLRYAEERAASLQNRIADAVTAFAGSMTFVYIHIVVFGYWLITSGHPVVDDPFPFGLLTMVVSLEAIFLSTFVMISQNRADEHRRILAADEWAQTQAEWKENDEILGLSRQVLDLSQQIHALTKSVQLAVASGQPASASELNT